MSFRITGLSPEPFRAELFDRLLAEPAAQYLQVHYARRGCYAARVTRG